MSLLPLSLLPSDNKLKRGNCIFPPVLNPNSDFTDEDITPKDTNDAPQDSIQAPITHARTRQLNLRVSSFLSNVYCEFENRLLPNDLIVLRNKGEDHKGRGEDLGGVEDQRPGRPF